MNFYLLRPVVFANLKVGDKLVSPKGQSEVAYIAPDFAVIRFTDNAESPRGESYMELHYRLPPLCWVEDKPVYPGDVLYYHYSPSWQHNDKGVVASSVRDDELHFHGGIAFPIADATWTKPEQKPVPSFQVEGQDVYPGDTVYYYGTHRGAWGDPHTVKENARVVQQATGANDHVESFDKGAEAFRLKPLLVIGEHLVPMPVRDAAEMKKGDNYYTPCLDNDIGYLSYTWSNHSFDIEMCDKGLVHRTKEAASAHTGAFIALSKRKG